MTDQPAPQPSAAVTTLPGPRGRSAWSKTGVGGTLEWDGKSPGRYYCLAAPNVPLVGSGGWSAESVDERAVHGAVVAIQRALRQQVTTQLGVTGVFDRPTADAALRFRRTLGLDTWGGIGPATARALFMHELQRVCAKRGVSDQWEVVCGIVQNESGWDPGAVGYIKPVDIGLAQINGDSHPDMSEKERLRPPFAFNFIIDYLTNAMKALDGNVDHAIISYNLGITGTRRWIAAGSPEIWTPEGSTTRNVHAYVERIKTACSAPLA
jgi:hypothetical protein